MSKLTEILDELNQPHFDYSEYLIKRVKAEQAILAWVDEVIGEDEDVVNVVQQYANNLRAEQRKRARS